MKTVLLSLVVLGLMAALPTPAGAAVSDDCAEGGIIDVDRGCTWWTGDECALYVHSEPTNGVLHSACINTVPVD